MGHATGPYEYALKLARAERDAWKERAEQAMGALMFQNVVLPNLERLFDMAQGLFRCVGCGDKTYNPERCRDCDIEHLITSGLCRECGVWIVREDIAGPMPSQHKPECTLRLDRDPFPRPL